MAKYKFKVLAGGHSENEGTDQNPKLKRYRMNDIVETDQELDKMFNSPGATKFARLDYTEPDTEESLAREEELLKQRREAIAKKKEAESKAPVETSSSPNDDYLDKMDLNELRSTASANSIPLGKAKTREEVLKVIKEALVEA